MDDERFRKELEARTAAHGGDRLAAIQEMLAEVRENIDALPTHWKELAEIEELLELEPEERRSDRPDSS
jgi:hypothetical protein